MQHLDEGILQAWLDRPRSGLDPSEIAGIERHLESCERCVAALDELRGTDERAHTLLAAGVDRDMPRPPFEEVVRRARGAPDARGGGSAGGPRLRLNRMAWAASIVVALGVGWMTNEMVRSGAVPVGESVGEPVQPDAARDFEAQRAPEETPAAAATDAADATDAAATAAARASQGAVDDVAGAGAAPERVATPSGRADLAPQPAAPPAADQVAADQVAAMERREADEATALADLAGDGMAVVSGVVRTVDGDPVPAAQVYVERFAAGTLSDSAGSYTLLLPRSELDSTRVDVVVERIGFRGQTRQVSVAGAEPAVADFGLQEEAIALQEVVVTGTAGGTQRRALGNAITTLEAVTVDALEWSAATPGDAQAVLGRAPVTSPGLDVIALEVASDGPDGASLVRVRQDLGDGSVLTLVQGAADASRDAWPLAADGAVESTRVGELLVTAAAPVSATFLRTLLAGVR